MLELGGQRGALATIARELGLDEGSVRRYLHNARRKLGAAGPT